MARRREMYLVGRSSGHSLFMQWPFLSPWSIGCSVQGQKLTLLVPFVLALRSLGLSLSVVSTGYCRAAKLTLVHS